MYGQLVHAQIVSGQVKLFEHLTERHGPFLGVIEHDGVAVRLHLLLDESQQMLLVHARCRMNVSVDFAHVVEIAMWHRLLLRDLFVLVEHAVKLEFRLEIVQTSIAERLSVSVFCFRNRLAFCLSTVSQIQILINRSYRGPLPIRLSIR